MEMFAVLRRLCESYPILFYIMIVVAILCTFPSLLLLFAVSRSSIHSNCRIMMIVWVSSQLLVYATIIWLAGHFIIFEKEYFTDEYDPKSVRRYICGWYATCWYACSYFELGISLERGFSIRNPSKYHETTTSYAWIAVYVVISITLSCVQSNLILSGPETNAPAMGALMSNILDLSSITANFLVLFIARRKDKIIEKQLNQRYQIREAFKIVQAMVPMYYMSTSLKIGIIIINWLYVSHAIPYSVCEVLYLVLSELACGVTSGMFLMYHTRLRSKICSIFGRPAFVLLYGEKDSAVSTEIYFNMLLESWREK